VLSVTCVDTLGIHTCFECKKTSDDMVKCSMPSCGRYYHTECLSHLGVTARKDSSRIICSQHRCATCETKMAMKSSARISKGSVSFIC